MKIFVINLPHRVDRRVSILKECERYHLEAELIDAVYGAKLTLPQIQEHVHDYPACCLTKGEIGCALSHINAYQKMVDENCEHALILEDDAVMEKDIGKVLSAIKSLDHNERPHAYLLSPCHYYVENAAKALIASYTVNHIVDAYYAYAYVINLKAAKAMLKFLQPIKYEADRWGLFQQLGVLRVHCVTPAPVGSSDEDKSTSDLESERHQTILARAAYLRVMRKRFPLSVRLKKLLWRGCLAHFYKVCKKKV